MKYIFSSAISDNFENLKTDLECEYETTISILQDAQAEYENFIDLYETFIDNFIGKNWNTAFNNLSCLVDYNYSREFSELIDLHLDNWGQYRKLESAINEIYDWLAEIEELEIDFIKSGKHFNIKDYSNSEISEIVEKIKKTLYNE